MSRRLEIENTDRADLECAILRGVRDLLAPLQSAAFTERSVITPAQAALYAFDGQITSARVCEYIRGKNLPSGIDLPLPARPIGSTYHIPVDRLNRWRRGEAGLEDLYDWQREKLSRAA